MMRRVLRRWNDRDWSLLLIVAGIVALLVAAVWWWALPPSERYYECLERRPSTRRNTCEQSRGSLAGPALLLALGMLLIVIGIATSVLEWRKVARTGHVPTPRRRRSR